MGLALTLEIFPLVVEFHTVIAQKLIHFNAAESKKLAEFRIAPKTLSICFQPQGFAG